MLDKELIKTKFQKSIAHYSENAYVQKNMADILCSKIPLKKYSSILEIGSYSGVLTRNIIQNFDFDSYLALDIVDSFDSLINILTA